MRTLYHLAVITALGLAAPMATTAEPITVCSGQAPWGDDDGTSFGQMQTDATCDTAKPWFRSPNEVIIQVEAKGFATAFSVHDRLDGYARHIPLACEGYGCREGYLNGRGMYTIPCMDDCSITATGPVEGGRTMRQTIHYNHFDSSFDATLNWDVPRAADPS